MRHHGEVLGAVLPPPQACGVVLDCAAGIGTLALSLAAAGYTVEGSDLAEASIERAQRETTAKGLSASFRIDDIRKLEKAPLNHYGAVLALENVIPHLGSEEAIRATLQGMVARLRPGGVLAVGIRDYEKLIAERPAVMPPTFHGQDATRRIVHEIWDWHDDRTYTFHLYITRQRDQRWEVLHFTGKYRAITTAELAHLMKDIGCEDVEVLAPEQSGFHQPIVCGKRKAAEAVAAAETSAGDAATPIPDAPVAADTNGTPASAAPEIAAPGPAVEPAAPASEEAASSPTVDLSATESVALPENSAGFTASEVDPTPTSSVPDVERGAADGMFEIEVPVEMEPAASVPENVVPFEYKEVRKLASPPATAASTRYPVPEIAAQSFSTTEQVTSSSDTAPVVAESLDITEALARLEPAVSDEDEDGQAAKAPELGGANRKTFVF